MNKEETKEKFWVIGYCSPDKIECGYIFKSKTKKEAKTMFLNHMKVTGILKDTQPNIAYEISPDTYYNNNQRNFSMKYNTLLAPPKKVSEFIKDIEAVYKKHRLGIKVFNDGSFLIVPNRKYTLEKIRNAAYNLS